MNTLPQTETRSVRIPEDCWEALRKDAFERRQSITQLLADIVRRKYKLPPPGSSGGSPEADGGSPKSRTA